MNYDTDPYSLAVGQARTHVAAARMDALIRRKAIECCVSDIECCCRGLGGRWYDTALVVDEEDSRVVASAVQVLDYLGLLTRNAAGWVQVPDVGRMFATEDSTEAAHG